MQNKFEKKKIYINQFYIIICSVMKMSEFLAILNVTFYLDNITLAQDRLVNVMKIG